MQTDVGAEKAVRQVWAIASQKASPRAAGSLSASGVVVSVPGIRRNIAFLSLSQGVSVASNLLVVALSARYLGVERFGQQAVLRSIALFSLPLLAGGLRYHIVRAIARDPEGVPSYLGSILSLRWFLALSVAVAAAIIIHLLPLERELEIASYAAVLVALSGVWYSVPRAILIAYERNEYNLLMGGVDSLLVIALTVVAIRLDAGVAGILAASALPGFAVAGAGQLLIQRHLVRPRLAIDLRRWWEIMGSVLPLGVGGVLRRSYARIDVWLLALLDGAASAALFSVAYRVALQLMDVSRLIATAIMPRISLLAHTRRDDLRTAVEGLLRILLVFSIAAAGLVAACAAPVLTFIVGPQFEGSIVALRLVAVVCVTALADAVLFVVLVALGLERAAVLCLAATVLGNVILDLLLIPSLGVRGACLGTIGAEWIYFTLALVLLRRELQIPSIWRLVGRPLSAGAAMAAAIWMAGPGHPVFGAAAGLLVFGLACIILRVLPRGSVRALRQALAVHQGATDSRA